MDPRFSRFSRVFKHFSRLGFNVVPAHPFEKHPAVPWKGLAVPNAPRVDQATLDAASWLGEAFPDRDVEAFLFPASAALGRSPCVVVDVDKRDLLATALGIFGDTDVRVTTRRGVHLYYRADPARQVVSRNWLLGEKGIDVKAWGAGVMAPGTRWEVDGKSGVYEPDPPLDVWTPELIETLPAFDYAAYEETWKAHRPKARQQARQAARARPDAYLHVVADDPATTPRGMEYLGDVAGDVEVTVERTGDVMPLSEVPPGEKVHAFDREDTHASGQVWINRGGQRMYTDHTLGVVWRVISKRELEWHRAYQGATEAPTDGALVVELRDAAIDVEVLPTSGYLDVPLEEGLTIIRAPHGTGKTEWSKRAIDMVSSATSITNTAALAEYNAARFGIRCYQDDTAALKISTTINSLSKIKRSPELVHVDEADQVHAYLHSGKVSKPVAAMHKMLDDLAKAQYALITSADLGYEDIVWFLEAYRRRSDKPVRVFVRPPNKERVVRLVSIARAKQEVHEARGTVALGLTERLTVGQIAWGYGKTHRHPYWISGENSRYEDVVEKLRGGADVFDRTDFFVFSPALQSGVSFTKAIDHCFVLHSKANFEAETVAQMLTRFRNVRQPLVWGVSDFRPRPVRYDDAYLEGVCVGFADATDALIAKEIPEYAGEFPHERAVDPEFALSWRITQRKLRRSFCDPIGRVQQVIEAHGWELRDERDLDGDPSEYNAVHKWGKERRESEVCLNVLKAPNIEDAEALRISKAYVHRGDEPQRLDRKRILNFYGLDDVTEADYRRDRRGRYRRQCREYAYAWLRQFEPKALAYYEYDLFGERQPSEYGHLCLRGDLNVDLLRRVADVEIGESFELSRDVIEARVVDYLEDLDRRLLWSERYGSMVQDVSKVVAWFGVQMRRIGGTTKRQGRNGSHRYAYTFDEVHRWSAHFREQVLTKSTKLKERKAWNNVLEFLKRTGVK